MRLAPFECMDSETIATPPSLAGTQAPLSLQRNPSKGRILVEMATLALLYGANHWVKTTTTFPWGDATITISNLYLQTPTLAAIALFFLWFHGGIRDVNFARPKRFLRCLGLIVVVLVLFRTIDSLVSWISYDLLKLPRIVVPIKTAITDPHGKWFIAFVTFPVFALAEEILLRAYLIQRIEVLASPSRHATLIAVLVTAVMHAWAHLGYGMGGALIYFTSGLVFAGIYLYSGRSLWFVAVLHYLMNLSALVALNFGLAR